MVLRRARPKRAARTDTSEPVRFVEASIDGIGTLRMPVVSEEAPTGLTGAQLPPVGTYRDHDPE